MWMRSLIRLMRSSIGFDERFDAMGLRIENRFDALATRIYWSAGIVTACLTIVLAIMTYILKVL